MRVALALSACLILAACGGGGGGGGGRSPGSITLSSNTLTFTTDDVNFTPQRQAVTATVTGVTASSLFIRIVVAGPAVDSVSNVEITSPTTGLATVRPASAAALGPGQYTSTITVSACTTDSNCTSGHLSGSPQTVNVTYTINGITVEPIDSFTVQNDPAAASQNRFFLVRGYPTTQNWTATSSAPWLSVTPSGLPGSQATISLVAAQVDTLLNGTYPATVTFTPAVGQPVVRDLSLTIARTQVNYVSPYVSHTNTAKDVIVRGEGFDKIDVTGVSFGSTSATSFQVDNDTQIRATHPALVKGSYDVQLESAAPLAVRSSAQLVVVDPPAYTATTLEYPDGPTHEVSDACYDEERRSIYVVGRATFDNTSHEIRRFTFDGTDWNTAGAPTQQMQFCALAPGGKEVILAKSGTVTHVNPTTLQTVQDAPIDSLEAIQLAASNDGYVYSATQSRGALFRYSIRTRTSESLTAGLVPWHGSIAASADGSRVFMSLPSIRVDTATNALTQLFASYSGRIAVDGTGERILFAGSGVRVVDSEFAELGRCEDFAVHARAVAISADGTRAYVLQHETRKLHTYDLTSTPDANNLFAQIGAGTTIADPGFDVSTLHLLLSKDDRTLFIVGGAAVVVLELP
jgi:hypothetical protein